MVCTLFACCPRALVLTPWVPCLLIPLLFLTPFQLCLCAMHFGPVHQRYVQHHSSREHVHTLWKMTRGKREFVWRALGQYDSLEVLMVGHLPCPMGKEELLSLLPRQSCPLANLHTLLLQAIPKADDTWLQALGNAGCGQNLTELSLCGASVCFLFLCFWTAILTLAITDRSTARGGDGPRATGPSRCRVWSSPDIAAPGGSVLFPCLLDGAFKLDCETYNAGLQGGVTDQGLSTLVDAGRGSILVALHLEGDFSVGLAAFWVFLLMFSCPVQAYKG